MNDSSTMHRSVIRQLAHVILALPVVYIGWRCLNYVSGILPPSDSAIFVNIAHHLINGKRLYRDVWDHKQPVIFVVNAVALKLWGETFNSIRIMERCFAVCAAIAFFTIISRTFKSCWITVVFSILCLIYFYSPTTFTLGNFTEEYGAVFMFFGILFSVESMRSKAALSVFLAGLFFSLSVFTKEPFLLSALPWIILTLTKNRRRNLPYLAAGIFLPLISAAVYFFSAGTLSHWLDMISFNFAMSHRGLMHTTTMTEKIRLDIRAFTHFVLFAKTVNVLFLFGVISVFWKSVVRQYGNIPLVIVCWFMMSLLAVIIENNNYNHYYIQVMPAFVMTAACGAAFLVFGLRRAAGQGVSSLLVMTALVSSILYFDYDIAKWSYDNIIACEPSTVTEEPVAIYIKEHTKVTDSIWAPSYDKYLYLQSGRLSPTKYLFIFPHITLTSTIRETGEERLRSLLNDLKNNPPAFIFVSKADELDYLSPAGIPQWINQNYTLDSTWHNGLLLRRQ